MSDTAAESYSASPIPGPAFDLPAWARRATNLANPRLGARGLCASDEFFAPLSRMLDPRPPVFIPGKYDANGKWMDGWETRRKRTSGHDWCLIRLAGPGTLAGFQVDTSHFTGNYAPAIAIEATRCDRDDLDALASSPWTEVLPAHSLAGNSHAFAEVAPHLTQDVWTHLRVHIYPDGGVARLRAFGRPLGLAARGTPADTRVDLAALENGARAVAWNDAHFGAAENLLLPGRGINMGDGWETRRRREPGHDWCLIELAAPGIIEEVEVDTAFFKGNFPDRCSLQGARVEGGTDQSLITQSMFWPTLLPESPLSADGIHRFQETLQALGPITHVRFNIHPDGGVSRLRLWGKACP